MHFGPTQQKRQPGDLTGFTDKWNKVSNINKPSKCASIRRNAGLRTIFTRPTRKPVSTGWTRMPHWDMKCLGEKYRVSSRQIHINEPVTNTKSGCEECNLTDQRRDAGLDRNTQATTKYSANASGNIQIQIHKYNHANTNTDTNTNTQWRRRSHDRFGN